MSSYIKDKKTKTIRKKKLTQTYNLIVRVDRSFIDSSYDSDNILIRNGYELLIKGWLGYISDNYKREVKTALPERFDSGCTVYIAVRKQEGNNNSFYEDIKNKILRIISSIKLDNSINSLWLKCKTVLPYEDSCNTLLITDIKDIKISDTQWKINYVAHSEEDLVNDNGYIFTVFQNLGESQPLQFFYSFHTIEEAQNCINLLSDPNSKYYVIDTIKENYCIIANKGMDNIKIINSTGRMIL